jgi:Ricin-type beta-trefoil lectin domain
MRQRIALIGALLAVLGALLGGSSTAAASTSQGAAAAAPGRASVSTTMATAIRLSTDPVSALRSALTASPAVAAVAPFEIVNYKSHRCLGIAGGADNAPAVLWNCKGSADQIWHWDTSIVYGGVFARLVNNDGECLGVAGGSQSAGADIYGWSCGNVYNQFWTTLGLTGQSGYYYLYNWGSDLVIGVAAGSTANGAHLVQWNRLPHSDQYWMLPYGP